MSTVRIVGYFLFLFISLSSGLGCFDNPNFERFWCFGFHTETPVIILSLFFVTVADFRTQNRICFWGAFCFLFIRFDVSEP